MGQRIPEKEIANFQFVKLNTKPNTEKLTVDPRRVRTVSGLFIPKIKKSIAMTKEKVIFSVQ